MAHPENKSEDKILDSDFDPISEAELDELDRESEEDLCNGKTVEANAFFAQLRKNYKIAG